ncbi:MAG: hypothetical protein JSS30_05980 [Verrucomicrobia bacterium]|nr:hypothetical protein [Verrucomicrobiota bacterium]
MRDEVLADIDVTLNELITISEALKAAKMNHHFTNEIEALEKTQESLLARLMHRQAMLEMDNRKKAFETLKKEAIERKVVEYARAQPNQKRAKSRSARSKS